MAAPTQAEIIARRRAKAPPLNNFTLDENLPIKELKKQIAKIIKNSKPSKGGTIISIGPVNLSWVPDLNEGVIDVMPIDTKGRGPTAIARKLKGKFDRIRAALPADTVWGMNANTVKKHGIYKRWFRTDPQIKINAPDSPLFQKADNPGFALRTGSQQLWAGGAVPDYIARQKFDEYLAKRDERIKAGHKRTKASFEHKGMQYTFSKQGSKAASKTGLVAPDGNVYKIISNKSASIKEANRRALEFGATPKMSPWEWQAIDELYDYAGKMGYHVDHIKALANKGTHTWDNLQVLDPYDNLVKGAKEDIEGFFKPKMRGALTAGPMTAEDYTKYQRRITSVEKAKAALNRKAGIKYMSGLGYDEIDQATQYLWDMGDAGRARQLSDIKSFTKAGTTFGRRVGTLLPFVGAGFDALDVEARRQELNANPDNKLDQLQLALAVGTVGTSFWNEPANFALGVANLGIDAMRTIFEEEKREDFGDMMRGISRGIGHTARKLF